MNTFNVSVNNETVKNPHKFCLIKCSSVPSHNPIVKTKLPAVDKDGNNV